MKKKFSYPDGTQITIKSKNEKLVCELAQEAKLRMNQADQINKVEPIERIDM